MEFRELIRGILVNSMPKGDLRTAMFEFHNSMVGKSNYFRVVENPKTACGSCIQRVKANVMKYYHYEYEPKFDDEFYFTLKFGINSIPVYGIHKKR
jgi:hypothetical protein